MSVLGAQFQIISSPMVQPNSCLGMYIVSKLVTVPLRQWQARTLECASSTALGVKLGLRM
eukprot:1053485-Amphidinium_carterae.1